MKKDNKIKMFTITLITAIIMAVSSITVYSNVCAPKFYDYFIDTGVKYLMDGKYEEAILAFNKAIEIEEKSTEVRVYLAQGYIGNNEPEKAIEVLKEAQDLDITNEELLKEILEILNEIDADIAYEFLDRFINAIGKDNISDDINKILDSAMESPDIPVVDPAPGTYIEPISIKLKLDEIKVGHSFYYTTDGSEPNKNSQKYRGKIDIDKSTTIKLIGYNKNEESTEVVTLDYIIDTNIVNEIEEIVEESKDLLNNTQVGTNVGDTTEEAKKAFKLVIDKISDLLKKDSLNYDDASSIKVEIENALKTFKENIIELTDKSKLQSAIKKAQNLYNNSTEGTNDGNFKVGSKATLQNAINESKKINDSITSSQEKIDNATLILNNAINKFENSKVSTFTKEKALQYAINKYGAPFKDHEYFSELNINGYPSDKYSSDYYSDKLCLNEYEIASGLLTENGLKYYKIYYDYSFYGTVYKSSNELNVYEDGTIKVKEIFQ